MIVEGDSAGGGLAARLALYNRDRGKVPLKGQVLMYPMLDYRTGGSEDIYNNEYAGEFVWTNANNVSGWADLIAGQEDESNGILLTKEYAASPAARRCSIAPTYEMEE